MNQEELKKLREVGKNSYFNKNRKKEKNSQKMN